MIKTIGRLEYKEIKELKERVDEIYDFIIYDGEERAVKALNKLLSTPNYYVREIVGKHLANYDRQDKVLLFVLQNFTSSDIYGVRAAGLFYYWECYKTEPESLIVLLNGFWDNTPWEVEAIILDMWKRYPEETKKHMKDWLNSDNPKQKTLALHGIENLAKTDHEFIFETLARHIDEENESMQRKIENIIIQSTKVKPAQSYPYIRFWFIDGDDNRRILLRSVMDKLVDYASHRTKEPAHDVFYQLTNQILKDWTVDNCKELVNMTIKLNEAVKIKESELDDD
ncbi:MAG: hypothetical protein RBS16_08615 [Candidatus Cloacimonadales bacterium]|jgi:hypothetical protein|nr:hypothetical protein [Candidatus Cloacimonadota bacterium]MDD2650160.1 hypothetical protein [Candidatus Cloacimonadota bacterium]MDD3501218.1 hypothetical protein [Candidatus Cloacimonadota bacterium]MDX9978073.1 hypothetical protein [Candidatus Cloacimonadales bacterium]